MSPSLHNGRPSGFSLVSMKSSFFNEIRTGEEEDTYITIVSGFPRSGTSMMMQMLEAGGLPVVTDNLRRPDENNPKGYYEYERVKKIKKDSSWLVTCRGKAVKMVSMLLYHLPGDYRYKVIFMRREMNEILASQKVMLNRLGRDEADVGNEEMARHFEKHLRKIEEWLVERHNIQVIYVHYNEVAENPREMTQLVNRFMDEKLDVAKMIRIVDKSLYRQRKLE